MSKAASTDKMSALHNALAIVIAAQVQETVQEIGEEGKEGREYYTATPALLTVAARFLKDNDITCEVEDSEGLSKLADELAKRKRRKSNVVDIQHLTEEDQEGFG